MDKFYVTTPIYYPNDVPHIGHAYTTVAGDVLTRWRRMWGDTVFYLTGLDEHGQRIHRLAQEQGVEPKEFVDAMAPRFASAWDLLDIRHDDFIRTSEERHHRAVQAFLQAVYDHGDIELGNYEGLYCVNCEAYYAEDEVVGGNCPVHEKPVEHMQEDNYFFTLSRYEQRLLDHYAEHPEAVRPEVRLNEVLGFIRQGLQDFSMSRTSIDWGVPLPWDPAHVAYVWFDALFNYCSAVGYGTDDERFASFWPADYHLIAKDILRFHAVYWPAMLMAADLPLPKCVYAHGYLTVGGKKMSKTGLTQIYPADLVETFGVDGFRYHFVRDLQFGVDGEFSYEAMVARYNADLANNFGNLASRVLAMAANYLGGTSPEAREDALAEDAADAFARLCAGLENLDFAGGFGAVWDLIGVTNAYIEDRRPWELHKAGDAARVAQVLGDCLEALRVVALLSAPLIPRAAAELWRRLGLPGGPEQQRLPDAAEWGGLPAGSSLDHGAPLFPRIEVEE